MDGHNYKLEKNLNNTEIFLTQFRDLSILLERGLPDKGRYGCVGPGIRFLAIFYKNLQLIFDKSERKMAYLLKDSDF